MKSHCWLRHSPLVSLLTQERTRRIGRPRWGGGTHMVGPFRILGSLLDTQKWLSMFGSIVTLRKTQQLDHTHIYLVYIHEYVYKNIMHITMCVYIYNIDVFYNYIYIYHYIYIYDLII